MIRSTAFKAHLSARKPTIGTFVKTRDHAAIEVLGLSKLDTIVLDAEHAPFDRTTLDPCIMAARAADIPCLVRVPNAAPEAILSPLDMGATGVVVPHIRNAPMAEDVVRAAHYGAGGRGFAGSPRAAAYTAKPMAQHLKDSATQTTIVGQIEDPEAVDAIEDIVEVEGIDCLFVGRVDLTVSFGAKTVNDPVVENAIIHICEAANRRKRSVGLFLAGTDEIPAWIERGVSFFLISSDHGLMLRGANDLAQAFSLRKEKK